MCRITVDQKLNVTRAGGCVIKSRESITETYITACFTLSLTQSVRRTRFFVSAVLPFSKDVNGAAQRPVLSIHLPRATHLLVAMTQSATLRL